MRKPDTYILVTLVALGMVIWVVPGEDSIRLRGWQGVYIEALEKWDCRTAVSLLEKKEAEGDLKAFINFGELYETGRCVDRDLARAAEYYQAAHDKDPSLVSARLGYLYLRGLGVGKNEERARNLFRQAVLVMIGLSPEWREALVEALMGERGIPPELRAELDWIQNIKSGGPHDWYEAALQIREESGGDLLHEQAARDLLEKAAREGDRDAQYELGRWHLEDVAPGEPHLEAFGYFLDAAEQGHHEAQKELALLYESGDFGDRGRDYWGDSGRDYWAYYWLVRAKEGGLNVEEELERIGARLTDEEKQWATSRAQKGHLETP
ncbi:MAG: sel1 repeat family protein [Alphaproteobacteria bacterium]|nr:sel1 repeat family protein [Alphaproteobacteria bacterium]